jgi:hypothetical protein
MSEQKKSIRWSEFFRRKAHEQKSLEKALKGRLKDGYNSHINLDLDLYPIISEWNSNPWTFTIPSSCSGTPVEHGRDSYGPVNGFEGNPHACFTALSYMNHPMFGLFNAWVNSSSQGAINKSIAHDREGYEGLYVHYLEVNVPQQIIDSKDLVYLEKFWRKLKCGIGDFKVACNSQSEHQRFERYLPDSERRFVNLIEKIGQPIIFTTKDNKEYRAMLEDVFPYSSIAVFLKEEQSARYFGLEGNEVNSVRKIESWQGEELFTSDWMLSKKAGEEA